MLEPKEITKKTAETVTIHIIIRERVTFKVNSSSEERSVRTAVAYKTEEPIIEVDYS